MKYILLLLLFAGTLNAQIKYDERGIPSAPEQVEPEDAITFDSLANVISQINNYENQVASYNIEIKKANRQISQLKSHANSNGWDVQGELDATYYASVLSFTKYKSNDTIVDVTLELRPNNNIRVHEITAQSDTIILGRLRMVSDEVFIYDSKTFYGVYGRNRKIRWRNKDDWSGEWFK